MSEDFCATSNIVSRTQCFEKWTVPFSNSKSEGNLSVECADRFNIGQSATERSFSHQNPTQYVPHKIFT